jgi:hypothetical protein
VSRLAGSDHRRVVVKTYGRGSLLGFLSPLIAFLMVARGMNGWEASAFRDMERDATEMIKKGYRVVSSDEHGFPVLGIAWFTVTYQLVEPPLSS